MQILRLIILIGCCAAQSTQPTTTPAEAPLPPEAGALIKQLGSENWHDREAAQTKLIALGSGVIEALRAAANDAAADPELRSRAESAIAQIQENEQFGASIITIQSSDISVAEAVQRLSEQARTRLEIYPADALRQAQKTRIELDIDHEDFWDALAQITQKTGLALQQWDQAGPKLVQGMTPSEGVGVKSGPFLIGAARIQRVRAVELAPGNHPTDDFYIHFTGRAEPKLKLLQVDYTARLVEVRDELGNSLLPVTPQPEGGSAFGPPGLWQLTARLEASPNMGKRIAILRGSVGATIQTGSEKIEIDDVVNARQITRTIGNVTLTFKEIRKSDDARWSLMMTLESRSGVPGVQHWEQLQQMTTMSEIRLVDAAGLPFQQMGFSSSNVGEQTHITVDFDSRHSANGQKLGAPARLLWSIPTASKAVRIPFEFKDLPIP